MAFAIAYGIFEVPSNYLIKRLRPSVCHPLQHDSNPLLTTVPAMDSVPYGLLGHDHHGHGRGEGLCIPCCCSVPLGDV